MHPIQYKYKFWNVKFNSSLKKKTSVFMIGDLENEAYYKIKKTPFQIENRIETYNYLKNSNFLTKIESLNKLNSFLNNKKDNTCIVLNSNNIMIPSKELRSVINNFHFYLALPGVFMPLCHNIIEALSTGSIPIIHKTYANLMVPKLKHMGNAIIYESLINLKSKINFTYNLDKKNN